jgi:hypothetical protein
VLTSSCLALGYDEAIADKIVADQGKLRSFDGTIVETGIVPGSPGAEVVSRVRFEAPANLRIDVLSPEDYRGDVFACVGSSVVLYSRRLDWATRIENVPSLAPEARRALVRATVRANLAGYGYRERPEETRLGRPVVSWTVTPREAGPFLVNSRWFMDAETALPLEIELDRAAGDPLYRMAFRELRVNVPVPDLAFALPPTASAFDWDLASESLTLEAARAVADFPLLEPRGAPIESLTRTRIVRGRSRAVPMLCLLHESGPFHARVTETKDRGLLDTRALGIPIELDADPAKATIVGDETILTFVRQGVVVTVTTNLPPLLAARFARSLG